jgi:predicted nucleotide-binding protein (sugar kinase/HSP70/actin superfamily)
MRISYPHMGYLSSPIRYMLENLDVEVMEAPPISQKTLELGAFHSPEGVCLPYKVSMGNFLEGLEHGADTLVTMCGAGKCRLGFYGAVQKIALAKGGNIKFHTLNTDNLLPDLYRFLREAAPQASRLAVLANIALAVKKLRALDALVEARNFLGARADNPERVLSACEYGAGEIAQAGNFGEVNHVRDLTICMMRSYSAKDKPAPPQVAFVGEFYLLLEPYANHWLETALIRQGIAIKKFIHTGDWAYAKMFLERLGLYREEHEYLAQARPYLNHHVGGDGLKSVGTSLWSARQGYDGIVHVFPLGCMPEVVAQYALKNIAADYGLPLLTLSIDEHASGVGITTRLEAFVDCLKRKKPRS